MLSDEPEDEPEVGFHNFALRRARYTLKLLQQTVRRLKTSLAQERDLRKQAEHQLADIKAKGQKGESGQVFLEERGPQFRY